MFVTQNRKVGFERDGRLFLILQRRAVMERKPNRAPGTNWLNCGRRYELVEYDENRVAMERAVREFDIRHLGGRHAVNA